MGRSRPTVPDRNSNSATTGAFGARPNAPVAETPDVVDADYVVVQPVDTLTERPDTSQPVRPPAVSARAGMDILGRRAWRSSQPASRSGGPLFWIGSGMLVAAAFWMSGGHAVIRPMLTRVTAEPGLRIASVISKVDRSGLRPVLQIDGQAVNDGLETASMPPLNIEVLSPAGGSMHYKLGTARSPVEGGASFAFSSRLDLPKDGVKTVFVTFAE